MDGLIAGELSLWELLRLQEIDSGGFLLRSCWGVVFRTALVRGWKKQDWVKVAATNWKRIHWCSHTEIAPQKCPESGREGACEFLQSVPRKSIDLGEAPLLGGWRAVPREESVAQHQQPHTSSCGCELLSPGWGSEWGAQHPQWQRGRRIYAQEIWTLIPAMVSPLAASCYNFYFTTGNTDSLS